jgi:hypothetical protein
MYEDDDKFVIDIPDIAFVCVELRVDVREGVDEHIAEWVSGWDCWLCENE